MRTVTLLLFLALAATSLAATRTPTSYHEDFTTREFRDAALTTADWDTVTAALHVGPHGSALTGTWNSPGSATGVDVDGEVVFLADQAAGLQIVDVAEPTHPVPLGTFNTAGSAWDVDVEGDWAFVADVAAGLVAVDVTDPTRPRGSTAAGSRRAITSRPGG